MTAYAGGLPLRRFGFKRTLHLAGKAPNSARALTKELFQQRYVVAAAISGDDLRHHCPAKLISSKVRQIEPSLLSQQIFLLPCLSWP